MYVYNNTVLELKAEQLDDMGVSFQEHNSTQILVATPNFAESTTVHKIHQWIVLDQSSSRLA